MLPLLLAATVAAAPVPSGAYEDSVVVEGGSLHSVEHQVAVRSPEGDVFEDVDPGWLTVRLRNGSTVTDAQVRRFHGPAALTVVIDTSGSMHPARRSTSALVEAILLLLPPGDHVRIVAFNHRTSSTRWAEAVEMRADLLRQLLRHLASQRPARRPWACVQDAPHADEGDRWMAEWIADCTIPEQREIEREAVGWFVRRLQAESGGTMPEEAVREALSGFLPSDELPFVPGFESTLGLVVISDSGFAGAVDPWERAFLETLLVQRFDFAASGSVLGWQGGPTGEHASLTASDPEVTASRIVRALHSCLVVTAESESIDILGRDALDVTCRRPDGRAAHVIMTKEALPPLDVVRAAAAAEGAGDRSARSVVEHLVRRDGLPARVLERLMAAMESSSVDERGPAEERLEEAPEP